MTDLGINNKSGYTFTQDLAGEPVLRGQENEKSPAETQDFTAEPINPILKRISICKSKGCP
jgi:hypothetical protein